MEDTVVYPTWSQVGVPPSIVESIKRLPSGMLLSYLVLNRVFRFDVKAQYKYHCDNCGLHKLVNRVYDDYTRCEKCGKTNTLRSSPLWRMGKDNIVRIDEGYAASILQRMHENYAAYFNCYPPEGFLNSAWMLDMNVSLPRREPALGSLAPEVKDKRRAKVQAAFICGDTVEASQQSLAIAKAAVLCPFLWDDLFDWRYGITKDRGRETHLTPLINMWVRLSKNGRWPDAGGMYGGNPPEEVADDEQGG